MSKPAENSVLVAGTSIEAEEVEFYRKVLDAIADMVLCKGPRSKIIWANKAFRDYYGMTNDQLRDIIDAPFNEPDNTLQYIKDDHYVFTSGKTLDIPEEPVTRFDGELRIFHTVKSAIVGRSGEVRMTVGVSRDITNQKKTQTELDEYRRKLEDLVSARTKELQSITENLRVTLHSIHEGVISVDPAGTIRLANEAALAMVGKASHEVLNQRLGSILALRDQKTLVSIDPLQPVPATGVPATGVPVAAVLMREAGAEINVEVQTASLSRADSAVMGTVIVLRDVTAARQLEARLLQQQKLDSVGTLAGGIAHDFNNFLQSIMGNITLAQLHAHGNRELQAILARAEAACGRAQGVTRQLLAFSSGGKPLKRVQPIAPVIQESASFAVRGTNIKIKFNLPPDLWNCPIDDGQISQVVSNLVINAEQAMPEGGTILIEGCNLVKPSDSGPSLKDAPHVEIRVTDTGVGIDAENLTKIFDPYFTTKKSGSGLGLASAYSVIQNHDGYIHVRSEVGKGTQVTFALPATPIAASKSQRPDPSLVHGNGERILFMDDDDLIREALQRMLGALGYSSTPSSNADEAVALFKRALIDGKPYDCVILDLTIPGGRGGQAVFLELLKLFPAVKAIVSSGYSSQASGDALEEIGFSAVLSKPYTLDQLSTTLSKVLNSDNT